LPTTGDLGACGTAIVASHVASHVRRFGSHHPKVFVEDVERSDLLALDPAALQDKKWVIARLKVQEHSVQYCDARGDIERSIHVVRRDL
jgi:hypothetical protein